MNKTKMIILPLYKRNGYFTNLEFGFVQPNKCERFTRVLLKVKVKNSHFGLPCAKERCHNEVNARLNNY
jgi:hypothetical protein